MARRPSWLSQRLITSTPSSVRATTLRLPPCFGASRLVTGSTWSRTFAQSSSGSPANRISETTATPELLLAGRLVGDLVLGGLAGPRLAGCGLAPDRVGELGRQLVEGDLLHLRHGARWCDVRREGVRVEREDHLG